MLGIRDLDLGIDPFGWSQAWPCGFEIDGYRAAID